MEEREEQQGRFGGFWFFVPYGFSGWGGQFRLTVRGFANLRDGHRRLRSCLSATAVTGEQVWRRERIATEAANPLLYAVAVSVLASGLARTARPRIARFDFTSANDLQAREVLSKWINPASVGRKPHFR
jgi:hypothetical protein